jgi:6-phosphogluconolactonase
MNVQIQVVDDPPAVVGELVAAAARAGGALAVSGGRTAGAAYRAAAALQPDGCAAGVWFGDDRAVPPDDDRSNYKLVRETLLDALAVAPSRVERIEGELGAEEAADRYEALVRGLDVRFALNGIGEDGHTASLFPDAPSLRERERRVVAAEGQHEPFIPRVTMTPPAFAEVGLLIYLVTGKAKADAVARAFAGEPDEATPASLVRGRRTIAVLDAAAAAQLPAR